jgi:hypothetical protein
LLDSVIIPSLGWRSLGDQLVFVGRRQKLAPVFGKNVRNGATLRREAGSSQTCFRTYSLSGQFGGHRSVVATSALMRRSREEQVDTLFDAAISGATTSVKPTLFERVDQSGIEEGIFRGAGRLQEIWCCASSAIILALHAATGMGVTLRRDQTARDER